MKGRFWGIFLPALFFLLWFSSQIADSQGLSTEGKDFWVGYLTNWLQSSNNPIVLELYISADDTTHGTVTMPLQPAFTPVDFTVLPNSTKKVLIPASLAMVRFAQGLRPGLLACRPFRAIIILSLLQERLLVLPQRCGWFA